jgi:hypothetical protein
MALCILVLFSLKLITKYRKACSQLPLMWDTFTASPHYAYARKVFFSLKVPDQNFYAFLISMCVPHNPPDSFRYYVNNIGLRILAYTPDSLFIVLLRHEDVGGVEV